MEGHRYFLVTSKEYEERLRFAPNFAFGTRIISGADLTPLVTLGILLLPTKCPQSKQEILKSFRLRRKPAPKCLASPASIIKTRI